MLYNNSRVDELFDLGLTTADKDVRKVYYYEIQEILADYLPALNLVEHSYPFLHNSKFHGFWWDPEYQDTVGFMNMRTVWWEGAEEPSTGFPIEYIVVAGIAVVVVAVIVIYLRKRS